MDILIFILVVSIASGFLLAGFPRKVKRKEEKRRIVRKLRGKAHQYEWVSDIAKDAKPNEIKVSGEEYILRHKDQFRGRVKEEN